MKPRHGARQDAVAPAIVSALRERGAVVLILDLAPSEDATGEPDLLVGWLGGLTLIELKSPGGRISPEQKAKHETWARVGIRVHVEKTLKGCTDAIGMTGERAEANRRAAAEMCAKPPAPNPGQKALAMAMGMRSSVRRFGP